MLQLGKGELTTHLYNFLWDIWCTDKKRRQLVPLDADDRVRCNASWGAFYIDEAELSVVCSTVVERYNIFDRPQGS